MTGLSDSLEELNRIINQLEECRDSLEEQSGKMDPHVISLVSEILKDASKDLNTFVKKFK